MNQLNNQLDGLTKKGDKSKSMWEALRGRLDEIEQRYDAVFRAGFRLQNLGSDLNRIGQAGIGVLDKSVESWGDFEFALNRAAGALSIWSTATPIYQELRDGIYEVAQEARIFPAEDIARAVYYWGSTTGQTVENNKDLKIVMDGLVPIMKAAAITETDYQAAIKGTYSILVQYGLGLESARDVTEKLMLITQRTAAEYPDLINTFKMVGPVAASLGISFDEVATYTGLIADAGIRGTMSGRALRQTFIKLVDPTDRARDALDQAMERTYGLGASFSSIMFPDGEFIGFTEYIRILADVMRDLTQEQKNHLLGVITTQNELPVLTALIDAQTRARRQSGDAIDDEKYSLENAHEQFEQTFDLLKGSWQGVVGVWKNSVIPIVHLVGAEVARTLSGIIESAAEVAQSFYQWLKLHPQVTEFAVKLVSVLSVLTILAGAAFAVIGTLLVFGAGVALAVETLGSFVVMLGHGAQGLAALEEGTVAFGQIFRDSVGRIIGFISRWGGAIVLLATIFITNFGTITDLVSEFIGLIGDMAPFFSDIFDQAGKTLNAFVQAISIAFRIVSEAVGVVIKAIRTMLSWFRRTEKDFEGVADATGLVTQVIGTMIGVMLGLKLVTTVWLGLKTAILGVQAASKVLFGMQMLNSIKTFILAMLSGAGAATALNLLSVAIGGVRIALTFLMAHPVILALAAIVVAVMHLAGAFNFLKGVVDNFAMDFGDMGATLHRIADETGASYDQVKDRVKAAMAEQNMSFEEATAYVEAHGVSLYDDTMEAERAALAAERLTGKQEELGEATALSAEELRAMGMSEEQIATFLASTEAAVDGVTAEFEEANWAETVEGELAIAAMDARLAAATIPGEIAAGIIEGRDEVVAAANGLGEAVTDGLMNEARVGETRVKMDEAQQAIVDAINAGTPGAEEAARAEYIKLELQLAGYLLRTDPMNKEAAAILEKYITEGDPAVQAAAQQMYSALEDRVFTTKENIEQWAVDMGIAPEVALRTHKGAAIIQADLLAQGISMPIEDLVTDLAEDSGLAVERLSTAIEERAELAGTATGEVKKQALAELQLLIDLADDYGYDTGDAYADGLERAAARAGEAARWVQQAAQRVLEAESPPTDPTSPLRHIDEYGRRTMEAYGDGMASAAGYVSRQVTSVLSGAASDIGGFSLPALANEAISGGVRFETTGKQQLDVNVNVTSSDNSVSSENAGAIGDAIQRGLMLDRLEHMVTIS